MPVYTVTTTAAQDAVLGFAVAQRNAEQQSALTNQDFVQLAAIRDITAFTEPFRISTQAKVDAAYAAATPAIKVQVLTLLGVTP